MKHLFYCPHILFPSWSLVSHGHNQGPASLNMSRVYLVGLQSNNNKESDIQNRDTKKKRGWVTKIGGERKSHSKGNEKLEDRGLNNSSNG